MKLFKTNFFIRMLPFMFLLFHLSKPLAGQNEIPDSLVKLRIQYIQKVLDEGKPAAQRWWNGWLIGYSAATVAQGAVCLMTDEKGTRQDMVLGAATTFLGAAGQLVTPMTPVRSAEELAKISGNNPKERALKLQKAEELLRLSAQREKEGRSWKTHAICGVVNVSGGLITWFGFKRNVWAGLGNFALNTAITEAQIWSQPVKAWKNYEQYCNDYQSGNNSLHLKSKVEWFVGVYPGGVGLKLVF